MKFLHAIGEVIEDAVDSLEQMVESERERRREELRPLAESLGLEVGENVRLTGVRDGIRIQRFARDHGGSKRTEWWTHTQFELGGQLPAFMVARNKTLLDSLSEAMGTRDIQLGNSVLDPGLWIRADKTREDLVRRLLTTHEIEEALHRVTGADVNLAMSESRLEVMSRGGLLHNGDKGFQESFQLAVALNRALIGPWEQLDNEKYVTWNKKKGCAEGHYRGCPIRVEVSRKKAHPKTRITVWLEKPLPSRTQVVHREQLASNQEFDDMILDKHLSVITSNLEGLRERMCTDDARGPLLELLYQHRDSSLTSDRLTVIIDGHVGFGLREYLDSAVDLVLAIGGGR